MFERYVPDVIDFEGARVRVFLGSLLGSTSTATAFTPLVGAQIDLPADTAITLPVEAGFEHGVLVDTGGVVLDGVTIPAAHVGYRPPGSTELTIATRGDAARLILLGGEPFAEAIVMWWNFVGRSHDEVVASRATWMADVIGGEDPEGRFGQVVGYDGRALPAPELPLGRLRPRR